MRIVFAGFAWDHSTMVNRLPPLRACAWEAGDVLFKGPTLAFQGQRK